jgi:hypothetical protein
LIPPRCLAAVAAGGILMIWPAIVNGYPLLFSDTGAFMEQLLRPFMVWDKPWIYGPMLVLVSLKLTLWLPTLAQGLLVSWVLWRVQAVFRAPSPIQHLIVCLALVLGSAAPWFASLLMPDIFAPLTVVSLFLLAFDSNRRWQWPVTLLASFAIASHLTHLMIACACVAVVMLSRPRAVGATLAPLGVAVVLLVTTNLVGHDRVGLSPFGAIFGLARLVADGPAKIFLRENCPGAGYRMCDWVGRLPSDADAFLWDPEGPVWSDPGGPIALAPEASRIVTETILSQPLTVARGALANWWDQIGMVRFNEIVGDKWLDATVGARLRAYYPEAEQDRFQGSEQLADRLPAIATPWQSVSLVMLVAGSMGSFILLVWTWRNDRVLFGLTAFVVAGVLINAFSAGALSGPHDRYQSRIAWLVLLPPIMFGIGRWEWYWAGGIIGSTRSPWRWGPSERYAHDLSYSRNR